MGTEETDMKAALETCAQKRDRCLKAAGNDPLKKQQCILKYLRCILPWSGLDPAILDKDCGEKPAGGKSK